MSDDDFNLEDLAVYLHLDAGQLARLAERGKLPGRRVGGTWRFSRGEIHQWLEDRIGVSDVEELRDMEDLLERQAMHDDGVLSSITDLLPLSAIAIPLSARTRSSAIASMVDTAARTGWLWDPPKMIEAVTNRETLCPTAMDNGVALLHPRRPLPAILDRPFVALGRTERGIPFGNPRGVLTDLFILMCSVTEREHLHTLARLSRLLGDPETLVALRAAADAEGVQDVITVREQALLD